MTLGLKLKSDRVFRKHGRRFEFPTGDMNEQDDICG